MAMMHLVARWSQLHPDKDRKIAVATVDHGLRRQSRREAQWVGEQARAIGLDHEILEWEGAKPSTGLQDAAREARYRLLSGLAWRYRPQGPVGIVTAHTEDDQAETLLMRLARGSGLDGLTGMSASRVLDRDGDCRLVRPLLAVPGARLQATLEAAGLSWLEDPSNDSDRFERVRLRKAGAALAAIGLTNAKIALSARRLERARAALEDAAKALQLVARLDLHGGIYASLDANVLQGAAEDVHLRVMARLIAAFGGQEDPPRLSRLESFLSRLCAPDFETGTLGGAIVTRRASELLIYREPGRTPLPETRLAPGEAAEWDRRFRVATAPEIAAPVAVRALGAPGFAKLRQQLGAELKVPARAAAALPAFWQDGALIAVPPLTRLPGGSAAWDDKARLCSAEFLW